MVQNETDDFNWTYEHVEDDFEMPPGGHILVDASSHKLEEKAIISSPDFTSHGLQCASFWYCEHFQCIVIEFGFSEGFTL